MKEVQDKVEKYLKKQFPNRKLVRMTKKANCDGEIWGMMGMIIMGYDKPDAFYYEIIKRK